MKILIFGGGGMLGHKLVQCLSEDFEVWTTIRGSFKDYEPYGIFTEKRVFENVDINKEAKVKNLVDGVRPDVIINAVGIIKQLPDSNNVIEILKVNSIFPHFLKEVSREIKARLINISTDCVFNGEMGNYAEPDAPDARDLYGKSKNLGEVTSSDCLTLRTSIIGRQLFTRHSLVEWFFSNRGKKIKGYKNAVFSGFPTVVLAGIISDIIANHPKLEGLYHLSSAPIAKFDLLNLIKETYKVEIEIEPFEDFYIDRTLDSTKFRAATGFAPPSWKKMIETMADDSAIYSD